MTLKDIIIIFILPIIVSLITTQIYFYYEDGYWRGEGEIITSGMENLSLINPTYKELIDFMNTNKLDKDKYTRGEYDCKEFSSQFVNNFAKEGYFSCVGLISNSIGGSGHAIVSIYTTDKGLIYIEPQSDMRLGDLRVGDKLSRMNVTIRKITSCFSIVK